MQLSGETNKLDLYSDARVWCGIPTTDTTTYTLAEFVRDANFGLDKVNALALRADGKWKFNDANNTSELLDTTTAFVSGTGKYAIPITWLQITRVRAKDPNGDYKTLTPVSRRELTDNQLKATGTPTHYVKLGNYIYPYPVPDYSVAAGLEVQQQMGSTYFSATATTTVPGFDSRFHRLISFYGSLDYCERNELNTRASKIQKRLDVMEAAFIEAIRSREDDEQPRLKTKRENYGQIC